MNIVEKLLKIQTELKAPKGQRNAFGKYNYRSAEDILEAAKPICKKHKCLLKITEEIKELSGVLFINSYAKLIDAEEISQQIESMGTAIIDFEAKGMQMPQRTGAASSYAKKYALGNLLMIDDTKDSDATNDHKDTKPKLPNSGDAYNKVIEYLKGGGSIAKVTSKYSLTNEQLNTLKKL